jgi:hypothetical protein
MAYAAYTRDSQYQERINLDEERDVRYWTERLCCTEDELRKAVIAAGLSVRSVQQLLSR